MHLFVLDTSISYLSLPLGFHGVHVAHSLVIRFVFNYFCFSSFKIFAMEFLDFYCLIIIVIFFLVFHFAILFHCTCFYAVAEYTSIRADYFSVGKV